MFDPPLQVCPYSGLYCCCGTANCPNQPKDTWQEIDRVSVKVPYSSMERSNGPG